MTGTPLEAVALYVGINILITLTLAILVVRQRAKSGISLGSGGNEDLEKAIRAHGNNVEYVSIILPGLIALGLVGAGATLVHAVGILLTLGRVAHGLGLSADISAGRQIGTLSTWIATLAAGIGCVWTAL